jgi:hypothetical protein
VVEVDSKLHARGRNEGLDGHLSPYDSRSAYGTSKLALIHEARELERRYGDAQDEEAGRIVWENTSRWCGHG